ncbi:TPA: hypothetical protein ENX78_09500 [Candidatus Poribacteria bacterium]|nr:hypothetical protein [Candidatus Poribacteria bacterium]
MIFPSDAEIREFTAYSIRARKIIVEEFKQQEGRPPNELELQDLLKMVVVPFGILKQQNGNSHFQSPQIPAQKQTQQPEQKTKNESLNDSVKDIVDKHPELAIDGARVIIKKKIQPTDIFYEVRGQFEKLGWKYVNQKEFTGGTEFELGHFEKGAKA